MKVLLFGFGSVGTRHARNLHALGHHPLAADPLSLPPAPGDGWLMFYRNWGALLADHGDADAAVIASPTECHEEQSEMLDSLHMPYYVEKPLMTVEQYRQYTELEFGTYYDDPAFRCAIGHQYRWHAAMPQVRAWLAQAYRYHSPPERSALCFVARDSLLARYGPQVGEMMACHMFDTATWLLGPALQTFIDSNGITLTGCTVHAGGRVARYDCDMNSPGRTSTIGVGKKTVELTADNDMYVQALSHWLDWVGGGEYDERTATLAQGIRVMDILAGIRYAETVAVVV